MTLYAYRLQTRICLIQCRTRLSLLLASSTLHDGIGGTHMNNVLSALDIPPISKATLKKAERKVGSVVESLAKESCGRQLQKECELTQQAARAQASPNCTKVGCGVSSPAGDDNHDNLTLSPSTIGHYEKRL